MNNKYKSTFFDQVARSIFANPFTHDRHISDCHLTGLPEKCDPQTVLKAAIHKVAEKIDSLTQQNKASLSNHPASARQSVANIFLFHLFHRYLPLLDSHICKQNTTSESLPLQCGKDLELDLMKYGFTEEEALKYIALFFQMRRAFYFIKNSLVGCSPCMQKTRAHLWNTVFTHNIGDYVEILSDRLEDFSTLLLGETGTGKGLAASAIGRSGFIPYNKNNTHFAESFTRAFLSINLCQFSEQLIEAELFGHAQGAFTGAVKDHEGIFSRSSSHGAVFLDEIGEVSIQTQIKLLRILQERIFSPVGSHTAHRFEGRIIGATHRDIGKLLETGDLREDFYFRLCTDSLTIPPLRQRIAEDKRELSILTSHLLEKITGQKSNRMEDTVITLLQSKTNREYTWPGNVRELEQSIRRILLHGTITLTSKPIKQTSLGDNLLKNQPTVAKLNRLYCTALIKQHGTLQAVARITGLDRRTVKKFIELDDEKYVRK